MLWNISTFGFTQYHFQFINIYEAFTKGLLCIITLLVKDTVQISEKSLFYPLIRKNKLKTDAIHFVRKYRFYQHTNKSRITESYRITISEVSGLLYRHKKEKIFSCLTMRNVLLRLEMIFCFNDKWNRTRII